MIWTTRPASASDSRIVVTRDGPHVFLYAGDEAGAHQAELVARELVAN